MLRGLHAVLAFDGQGNSEGIQLLACHIERAKHEEPGYPVCDRTGTDQPNAVVTNAREVVVVGENERKNRDGGDPQK